MIVFLPRKSIQEHDERPFVLGSLVDNFYELLLPQDGAPGYRAHFTSGILPSLPISILTAI